MQAFGSTASTRTFVVFVVNVMLVLSMQVFIGNSGIVSFGHVAFMGIGAYTTALLSIPPASCGAPNSRRSPPCCARPSWA